ncbi:hypothetical protein Bhz59_00062 [Stenotrophomonas phage vB_SmaS_Bhz59]
MANKKPTRKMPETVKKDLAKRRSAKGVKLGYEHNVTIRTPGVTTKAEAQRLAQAALKRELDPQTVNVRVVNTIDAAALQEHLNSPEGERRLIDYITRNASDVARELGAEAAPRIPSKEEVQADADDDAVENLENAMCARLAEKRAAGYSGWNDPTQCDARKLSRLYLDKLFGSADLVDLGNYTAFLFALNGNYALRTEVAERIKAIRTEARRLQEQLAVANKELDHARDATRRAEANLARAMGYIDRVTEGEPPVAGAQYREERHRVGNLEHVQIEGARRGPQLDLGSPYANHDDFMTRR